MKENKHKRLSSSVSIGYHREDGDFAILATLNNKDEGLEEKEFEVIVGMTKLALEKFLEEEIEVLEREDTPDYINLEEDL